MFKWLKALVKRSKADPASPSEAPAPEGAISVFDVVETFLRDNPQRTPWPVHALIAAGATRLSRDEDVLAACDKIEKHGYQYPLNPTIRALLGRGGHLLEFLRWQAANEVPVEEYEHEMKIRSLVDRFQAER